MRNAIKPMKRWVRLGEPSAKCCSYSLRLLTISYINCLKSYFRIHSYIETLNEFYL